MTCYTVRSHAEAHATVSALAHGLPVFYGTGNPIEEPHVQVRPKDGLSGEGIGYWVTIKPEGDGYLRPCTMHEIVLAPSSPRKSALATIETRQEREPDSDGWYTASNRYALVDCPECGHSHEFSARYLGDGDTIRCDGCKLEFAVQFRCPVGKVPR